MKIGNLKRLNKQEIEDISVKVLTHFNENYFTKITPTPLKDVVNNLFEKKYLNFEELSLGFASDNSKILGCYVPSKRLILIDSALKSIPSKYHFVLGHELGHFVLHRSIIIPENEEDIIQDSENKIFSKRRQLLTDLDFMEWQANYFASVMLLPIDIFYNELLNVRKELGLPWRGRIYVDNQKCTRTDYYNTLNILSDYFKVSQTVVEIRLKELKLLEDNRKDNAKSVGEIYKEILDERNKN